MVSLEQMRKRLWDEMDQSQRAEYMDEYRAQVAAGKAADVVYRARHEAGLTQRIAVGAIRRLRPWRR